MSQPKIISFNAEGLSPTKCELLANLNADVLCLQETHKDKEPPKIPGMHLIIYHMSPVHGSAIYARDQAIILNSSDLSENGLEILQIDTAKLTIISVYKPPTTPFTWPRNHNIGDKATLVIGDFNSHNTIWGYSHTNNDGDAVELWALNLNLTLIHDAKHKPSFHRARWNRGYNPDLVFASSRHSRNFEKSISDPIPRSQHRPITIEVKPVLRPTESKPKIRFNFRKANWEGFSQELDARINDINPDPENYDRFQNLVWSVAKGNIPRGYRKTFIPCLSDESKEL